MKTTIKIIIFFAFILIAGMWTKSEAQCFFNTPEYVDSIHNPLELPEPLTWYFSPDGYSCIHRKHNGLITAYGNTGNLLQILAAFGPGPSPFDYNNSQDVNTSDLLIFLTGYGSTNQEISFYQFDVMMQASSGWWLQLYGPAILVDGQEMTDVGAAFMFRTGYDEPGMDFDEGCLNSFKIHYATEELGAIEWTFIKTN